MTRKRQPKGSSTGGQFASREQAEDFSTEDLSLDEIPGVPRKRVRRVPLPRLALEDVEQTMSQDPSQVEPMLQDYNTSVAHHHADRVEAGIRLHTYTEISLETVYLGTNEARQYAEAALPVVASLLAASQNELAPSAPQSTPLSNTVSQSSRLPTADDRIAIAIEGIIYEINHPESTQTERQERWNELHDIRRLLAVSGRGPDSQIIIHTLRNIHFMAPRYDLHYQGPAHPLKNWCVVCSV